MSLNSSPYEIRKAIPSDAEGISYVHVKAWQTSYVGMIEQAYLDAISYDERLQLRKRILNSEDMLVLVVVYGEKIVGFADAGSLRAKAYNETFFPSHKAHLKYGEIYAIYLLKEHQGKGLGHELYEECRRWFKAQSYSGFVTWGLAKNVCARQFYEREGGRIVGKTVVTIGNKEYEEYCYLFENIYPEIMKV